MINFRLLRIEDEPFLWEMLYLALYVPAGYPPFPLTILQQPEISRYVVGWGRVGDLGLMAMAESRPVGAAWLRLLVGDQRGFGYVDEQTPELSVALLPAYRGQGIGRQLLTQLLAVAAPHYSAISLSVSRANPAGQLYRRLGFVTVAESDDSQTMCCQLKSQPSFA